MLTLHVYTDEQVTWYLLSPMRWHYTWYNIHFILRKNISQNSEYKPRTYTESSIFDGFIQEEGGLISGTTCVWSFSHLLFLSQEREME